MQSFDLLREATKAVGQSCQLPWPEKSAHAAGAIAPRRAGMSRAGKAGRAGAFPARNDTERDTPARRGAVKIRIDQRYPLAEVARAHTELEARNTTGCSI